MNRSCSLLLGHWLLLSLPLLLLLPMLLLIWGDETAIDLACRIHRLENPGVKAVFSAISDWGNPLLYTLGAWGLVSAWRRGDTRSVRHWLTFAVLQILLSFLLVRFFKIALGAPRPDAPDRMARPLTFQAAYHAMPSGHTAEVTGTTTALALAAPARRKTVLLGCALALMAFSRIYLSWHSPSDVFAGWLVGSLAGLGAPFLADVSWRGVARRLRGTA